MLSGLWNRDHSCITVGDVLGFRVMYAASGLLHYERACRNLPELFRDGCRLAAVVDRSYRVLLVPVSHPHVAIVWDESTERVLGSVQVEQPVCGLLGSGQQVWIITVESLSVYNYELQIGGITPVVSWFLQWSCPTRNPDGILAVDRMMGQIGLWVLPGTLAGSVTVGRTDTIARRSITAHQESVVALALDASGNTLATGSSRGTVIRLWDTETGHQLRELRRGLMGTRLYGLGLSTAGEYLVATSAHGTLHWFAARSLQPNVRSWIGSLTTEWSRAQYSITRGWHQAQIHQGEAGCIIRVFSDGGWTALLVRESSDTPNDTISEIAKR